MSDDEDCRTTAALLASTSSNHRAVLLHGSLDIWIDEACNLPNKDILSNTMGGLLKSCTSDPGSKSTSDPYVTVLVASATVARTFVIQDDENPKWRQHFLVPVAHETAAVSFVVKDSDVIGAELIGAVAIPAESLLAGDRVDGVYPVLESSGKPCRPGATLRMSVQYVPVARLTMYSHGVTPGPDFPGVPNTYFPLRRGGRVTLYQDAHVPGDGQCLPEIRLGNGQLYRHGQCWHDVYDAMSQAKHLIYITGWSVFHTIRLVRDGGDKARPLGDLLKKKSQEGGRGLLLVWDDPTSRSVLGIQMEGYMGTRDEETRRFFKHSSVQILLCSRSAGKRHSWVKQKETGTIFTHHQKTVIVDADAGNGKRKIVAFVGGLDLCGGRYDTPRHNLFHTLHTVHKEDYYNPNFAVRTPEYGLNFVRDFHSRINSIFDSQNAPLVSMQISEIAAIDDDVYSNDNDTERWDVQIFRSIDSNSVKAFPKDPREATIQNLVCGKNVLIDMSIHTAYVTAIRAAQHFIYIENQYFLGSSFQWDSHRDLGANNLIPIEVALKIANKIYANERFSAYIIIPMWPEGNPTGAPTQRILYWQKKTMQMMYEIIYKALKDTGLNGSYDPQDYLNFFCLGNREAVENAAFSEAFSHTNPQIYGYRMSLWAEHTGGVEAVFERPDTLECVRRVRGIGDANWKRFVAEEVTEMRGHLIRYPVAVEWNGKVGPLQGCAAFPDVGGNICGSFSGIQENLTI
uniref:Phospholipase D n=1 Tax=Aegilops tauschii TaxID=37682 RepID=M8BAU5_AEGTA